MTLATPTASASTSARETAAIDELKFVQWSREQAQLATRYRNWKTVLNCLQSAAYWLHDYGPPSMRILRELVVQTRQMTKANVVAIDAALLSGAATVETAVASTGFASASASAGFGLLGPRTESTPRPTFREESKVVPRAQSMISAGGAGAGSGRSATNTNRSAGSTLVKISQLTRVQVAHYFVGWLKSIGRSDSVMLIPPIAPETFLLGGESKSAAAAGQRQRKSVDSFVYDYLLQVSRDETITSIPTSAIQLLKETFGPIFERTPLPPVATEAATQVTGFGLPIPGHFNTSLQSGLWNEIAKLTKLGSIDDKNIGVPPPPGWMLRPSPLGDYELITDPALTSDGEIVPLAETYAFRIRQSILSPATRDVPGSVSGEDISVRMPRSFIQKLPVSVREASSLGTVQPLDSLLPDANNWLQRNIGFSLLDVCSMSLAQQQQEQDKGSQSGFGEFKTVAQFAGGWIESKNEWVAEQQRKWIVSHWLQWATSDTVQSTLVESSESEALHEQYLGFVSVARAASGSSLRDWILWKWAQRARAQQQETRGKTLGELLAWVGATLVAPLLASSQDELARVLLVAAESKEILEGFAKRNERAYIQSFQTVQVRQLEAQATEYDQQSHALSMVTSRLAMANGSNTVYLQPRLECLDVQSQTKTAASFFHTKQRPYRFYSTMRERPDSNQGERAPVDESKVTSSEQAGLAEAACGVEWTIDDPLRSIVFGVWDFGLRVNTPDGRVQVQAIPRLLPLTRFPGRVGQYPLVYRDLETLRDTHLIHLDTKETLTNSDLFEGVGRVFASLLDAGDLDVRSHGASASSSGGSLSGASARAGAAGAASAYSSGTFSGGFRVPATPAAAWSQRAQLFLAQPNSAGIVKQWESLAARSISQQRDLATFLQSPPGQLQVLSTNHSGFARLVFVYQTYLEPGGVLIWNETTVPVKIKQTLLQNATSTEGKVALTIDSKDNPKLVVVEPGNFVVAAPFRDLLQVCLVQDSKRPDYTIEKPSEQCLTVHPAIDAGSRILRIRPSETKAAGGTIGSGVRVSIQADSPRPLQFRNRILAAFGTATSTPTDGSLRPLGSFHGFVEPTPDAQGAQGVDLFLTTYLVCPTLILPTMQVVETLMKLHDPTLSLAEKRRLLGQRVNLLFPATSFPPTSVKRDNSGATIGSVLRAVSIGPGAVPDMDKFESEEDIEDMLNQMDVAGLQHVLQLVVLSHFNWIVPTKLLLAAAPPSS
jgi:hypothetical protein